MNVRTGLGVALVSLLLGCSSSSDSDELTPAQLAAIKALSPIGEIPPDTTNKYADNDAVAKLGQKLFFEKRFSGPIFKAPDDGMNALGAVGDANKIGCVSCHDVNSWYRDTRSQPPQTSLGVGYDIRNSPTLINAQYYKWTENDGVVDMEWADGLFAIELPWVMGATRLHVAHTIYEHYKDEYNALFDPKLDDSLMDMTRFPAEAIPKFPADAPDGPWEMMAPADQLIADQVFVNFGKATGAYVRKLVSKNAPFDKYVAGDKTAITAAAERGLHLFVGKANCVACHKSPTFDDDQFHNTGYEPAEKQAHIDYITGIPGPAGSPAIVPPHIENGRFDAIGLLLGTEFNSASKWSDDTNTGKLMMADPANPDGGAMVPLAALESDKGKWRTKGLRSIGQTAPYFHNGQFATLLDVVKFYNDGGGADQSPDGLVRGYIGTKGDEMKKLNLTDGEMNDIVEFLGTLTGEEVPADLRMDTSNP